MFQDVQKRLEGGRPGLDSALEESSQLSAGTEQSAPSADGRPPLLARAQEVRRRWEEAERRCQTLLSQLQAEVEVRPAGADDSRGILFPPGGLGV